MNYNYYYKKEKNDNIVSTNNVLIIGSAENRKSIQYDSDKDMPDLLNPDGSIYDSNNALSDFEMEKESLFQLLDLDNFTYTTVDPSYSLEKKQKKLDDIRYKGHIDKFLINIPEVLYHYIVVMGCYRDFFGPGNIHKLKSIMASNSRLIIYDSVPYNLNLLEKNFNKYIMGLGSDTNFMGCVLPHAIVI